MPPTWYQFNFPKQVILEGHRQENMSYNFSTGHFIVIFFPPWESTKGRYILVYSIFSCPVNPPKKQTKNTEKEREKTELCVRGKKKISMQVLQESKQCHGKSRMKGNISFLRFGKGNNEVCYSKHTSDKDSALNLVLNLSRRYDIVSGTKS